MTIDDVNASRPVLTLALILGMSLAAIMIVGGIVLVVLGSSKAVEISLFGGHLKTQSVGVAGIFCGGIVTVLCVRRVLESLERISALPPDERKGRGRAR
jgi:hypothetical protein